MTYWPISTKSLFSNHFYMLYYRTVVIAQSQKVWGGGGGGSVFQSTFQNYLQYHMAAIILAKIFLTLENDFSRKHLFSRLRVTSILIFTFKTGFCSYGKVFMKILHPQVTNRMRNILLVYSIFLRIRYKLTKKIKGRYVSNFATVDRNEPYVRKNCSKVKLFFKELLGKFEKNCNKVQICSSLLQKFFQKNLICYTP